MEATCPEPETAWYHASIATPAAKSHPEILRMRAAVFCQGSTAKGRQIANTGMRKAPAPVNRIAPAARAKLSWLGIPEASSAVFSKPPAVQRSADTAKTMLASGVPGSLAARRVRTSSRTVIRNPVVKPIKSPAKYGPADMVTTCNVLTRIAMYGDARPAACRGRGGPQGQRGLRWGRRFRLPRPLAGDSCSRLLSRRSEIRSEEHTSELQSPCNLVCR